MSSAKKFVNNLLSFAGLQIYSNWELELNGHAVYTRRRSNWLREYGVTKVIDVGANGGQYGLELRSLGYLGDIVSFEPLSEAFAKLRECALKDGGGRNWKCINCALGASNTESVINRFAHDQASSLLEANKINLKSISDGLATKEVVQLKRLDSIWSDIVTVRDVVWIKLDVQGYESHVLDGLSQIPSNVCGFEIELSLLPLYDGQALFPEMVLRMHTNGFRLFCNEEVYVDKGSDLPYQLNGVFMRY